MTDSEKSETSSVLSKDQRKWLAGEDVYDSPDRVVKSRVKQRYMQAISDLALLARSERITDQERRNWVAGDISTSSNEEVTEGVAEHGRIDEQLMADALTNAIDQVEVFGGMASDDATISDFKDQFKEIQKASPGLEDKWYPRFAAFAAFTALEMSGKTKKQARQWIEHHWMDSDETLERVEEMKERGWV